MLGNSIMNHAMAHAVNFSIYKIVSFTIDDCVEFFSYQARNLQKKYTSKMHSQDLTLLLKMNIYASMHYLLFIIV